MKIIDGENCILGRLASYVAKEAINGEEIRIVNVQKIIITGTSRKAIMTKYKHKINLRNIANPEHSPGFSRRPDYIVRKTIWGMIPHNNRGTAAYKRIKAYIDIPKEFEKKERIKVSELKDFGVKKMSIMEISKELGWRGA